ncbi:uncharacterized protein EDB93DRAFT_166394 [Suillus bovinus]|uniref:uncharacterized protein n=1 Tax=Suillus bovinus TaxID=48563 RepID=UPI001B879D1A|nr:uncharacterized protein EDB93DRAFT_166394 [Suillus bovinus]KAG2154511.1 hypothetical protein EDB93DRAFT_166394 [Suillus bovinus]
MMSSRRLVFAFKVILATVVGVGLGNLIIRGPWSSDNRSFKGIALSHDLSLQIDFGDPVWMRIDQTAHYSAHTDEGGEEYAKLIPRGGHTVQIKDAETGENRVYTVTLFHQLKCLGIIRDDYAEKRPPSSIARHCMNYLRQSISCRPNIRIEPTVNNLGTAVRGYETVCRDWTKLYEEVDKLHGLASDA